MCLDNTQKKHVWAASTDPWAPQRSFGTVRTSLSFWLYIYGRTVAYRKTRERLGERERAAKVPVFPQVPFSSTSEDLEQERGEQWNGCSVFHNLKERERTSMLWEFPTNLITLLLDLKSHMLVTHTATCENYNLHSDRLRRRGLQLGMNSTSDMFILLNRSNVCQQNH